MEQGVYRALKCYNKTEDEKLLVGIEYDDAKILLNTLKEKALESHQDTIDAEEDLKRYKNLLDTIKKFEEFVYEFLLDTNGSDNGDD